jgi:hypothetical protein
MCLRRAPRWTGLIYKYTRNLKFHSGSFTHVGISIAPSQWEHRLTRLSHEPPRLPVSIRLKACIAETWSCWARFVGS